MDPEIAPAAEPDRFLRLGDAIIDLERNLVLREGELHRLEPRAVAVLRHLLVARGRVVSRDELMREVWKTHVVDEAVQRVIAMLRQALGAPGPKSVLIETLPRKGYRLTVEGEAVGPDVAQAAGERERARLWPKLSIAFVAGMLVSAAAFLAIPGSEGPIAPKAPPASGPPSTKVAPKAP